MRPITNDLALAGLAVALGLAAGCSSASDTMTQGGKGAVRIVMSASAVAPVSPAVTEGGDPSSDHELQAANVTFASILARNLDGELIDVTIDLPVTVDLLELVSGGSLTLPAGFLPPGTYDQLVIVMTKLELTLASGTVVTVDPPGGGWTAIVPVAETFTVAEGQTTTVRVIFRHGSSFHWLNGEWEFHPDFDGDDGDGD